MQNSRFHGFSSKSAIHHGQIGKSTKLTIYHMKSAKRRKSSKSSKCFEPFFEEMNVLTTFRKNDAKIVKSPNQEKPLEITENSDFRRISGSQPYLRDLSQNHGNRRNHQERRKVNSVLSATAL